MPLKMNVAGVQKPVTVWNKVGATWKKVIVKQNVGGVWKQITSLLGASFDSVGSYLSSVEISPTDCYSLLMLANDGAIFHREGSTPRYTQYGWWMLGGVASNYEARWTTTSGTLSSGTAGTWQNLSTSRWWGSIRTTNTLGTTSVTGTLEIRMAASPYTVLATKSFTLAAEVG